MAVIDYDTLPIVPTGRARTRHNHEALFTIYNGNSGISCPELCKKYEEETGTSIATGTARNIIAKKVENPFSSGRNEYTQEEVNLIATMAVAGKSVAETVAAIKEKVDAGEEGYSVRTGSSVTYKRSHIVDMQSASTGEEETEPETEEVEEVEDILIEEPEETLTEEDVEDILIEEPEETPTEEVEYTPTEEVEENPEDVFIEEEDDDEEEIFTEVE